ncbi:MAG TPA: hypothetical protein VEA36_00320, partial [Candidatus Paceibacterota bacterium]|nr:hypothetical protein [Candidatus Paceibacterota bacterium]
MGRKKKEEVEAPKKLARIAGGIALIAFGLIFGLSAFGLAGLAGEALFAWGFGMIGLGSFLIPILMVLTGIAIMFERSFVKPLTALGAALIVVSVVVLFGMASETLGGSIGRAAGITAIEFFGFAGALILLLSVALIGLAIVADLAALISGIGNLFGNTTQALGSLKVPAVGDVAADVAMSIDTTDAPVETTPVEREPVVTMFNE